MMRTTGYSLSITGQMQADGRIEQKVCTHRMRRAVPAVHRGAGKRGVKIEEL
jgi:hypothetical protein